MKEDIPTRERIVEAGWKALLEHGYAGTGLGPLLASIDVPKGSFYHFFASKEAFAAEVLAAYAEHYRARRLALFADPTLGPLARLDRYLVDLEEEALSRSEVAGCLYGVMALAVPSLGAPVKERLAEVFARWEADFVSLITEAQQAGEVDLSLDAGFVAACVVDLYEGAIIRARAGDGAAFSRFRACVHALLGHPATVSK